MKQKNRNGHTRNESEVLVREVSSADVKKEKVKF